MQVSENKKQQEKLNQKKKRLDLRPSVMISNRISEEISIQLRDGSYCLLSEELVFKDYSEKRS